MIFRKIVNYLGEPEKLEVWKTPKETTSTEKPQIFCLIIQITKKKLLKNILMPPYTTEAEKSKKAKRESNPWALLGF